jgi:hypothetical protein
VAGEAHTADRVDATRKGAWGRNLDRFSGLRVVRTQEAVAIIDDGSADRAVRSSPMDDYERVRRLMDAGLPRTDACIQVAGEVGKTHSTIESSYYVVRRRLGVGTRHHPPRRVVAPQASADYERVTDLRLQGIGVVAACRIVAADTGRLERSVQQSYYRAHRQRRQLGLRAPGSPESAAPGPPADPLKEAEELAADIAQLASDLVQEVRMAVSQMQTEAAEVEDIAAQLAALRSTLAA